MTSSSHVRRILLYSGRVQGVGFRHAARQIARENDDLTGWVMNLPTGQVECVIEGPPSALDRFQRRVAERMGHYIEDVQIVERDATHEFSDFQVRH